MRKLQITHDGSPAEVECVLEKAVSTIQLKREKKEFSDKFMKKSKSLADTVVNNIFTSMIKDISNILTRED